MRPHLPLSLLSALMVCIAAPSQANFNISENGTTTITFDDQGTPDGADDTYTIVTPGQNIPPSATNPGIISLTEFTTGNTAAGENNTLFERTLILEGGTYGGLVMNDPLLNGPQDFPRLMNNENKFAVTFEKGAGLARSNLSGSLLLGFSGGGKTREIHGSVTINVAQDAGSFGGFGYLGVSNGSVQRTFGTYTLNVAGGNWLGATEAGNFCIVLGGRGYTHTGAVNYNITGGTFAGSISAGSANGTSDLVGNVNISIGGGVFGGEVALFSIASGNATNYGSDADGASHVARLSIAGGTFNADVKRGFAAIKKSGSALIEISGGTFNQNILTQGASLTIEGNNAVFTAGKNITGVGGRLSLNGVTSANIFQGVVVTGFDEIAAGEGTDAVIGNASALDGRAAFTKSGTGKLTLSSATGFANALTVSGGELHFGLAGGAAFGNAVNIGQGARLTSAGNMTLSAASGLALNLNGMTTPSSLAMVQTGGMLAFNAAGTLTLTISGVDMTMDNDYRLITAADFGTLTKDSFTFSSQGWSDKYSYALDISGGTLWLRVRSLGEFIDWNGGPAGTWIATGGGDIWKKGDQAVAFSDGLGVTFSNQEGLTESVVSISGNVAPSSITVHNTKDGTAYELKGDGAIVDRTDGAASLLKRGDGVLTISNTGTNTFSGGTVIADGTLNLNAAQGLGTGTVTLNGGRLVLNTEGATGLVAGNNLIFAGGSFAYGTGVQDISGLIDTAGSTSAIRVETSGNDIRWVTYNKALGDMGIVKSGAGELQILWAASDATFTGGITVDGGSLFYNATGTGSSGARTWNGNISIAPGASLQFCNERAHDSIYVTTLSGAISGGGDLILGKKEGVGLVGGGRYAIGGDNSKFTGTFKLQGPGTNAAWNEVRFTSAAAFGQGKLELDGRGFFVDGNMTVGADINVKAAGGWLNGGTNQIVTFTGKLASEANANFGLTSANPAMTGIFSGDLTGFVGTMHSGQGNGVISFGNGGAATTLASGEFIKAVSLGGLGTYRINYSGTGKDLLYAGNIIGQAKFDVQGSDKLILTGANTSNGQMTISQNSTVQLGDGTADNAAWAGTFTGGGNLIINTTGTFSVADRANGMSGTLTLAQGSLDLVSAAAGNNITINKGSLLNAKAYAGTNGHKVNVDAVANSGNIALGGLDASQLGTVKTTTAGTLLTRLKTGSTWTVGGTDSSIALAAGNISGGSFTGTAALIQFAGGSGSIAFGENSTLSLDLTAVMGDMKTDGGNLEILLTNGSIAADLETLKKHISANPLFSALGFGVVDVKGGNIVISGDTNLVYVSSVDGTGSAANPITGKALNFYEAVIVNRDTYVQSDGSMVIKNLTAPGGGQSGTGNLIITNGVDDKQSIEFNNNLMNGATGVDTSFAGNISGLNGGAANADLVKTGANKLTLGGTVNLAGTITAREGMLELSGTATVEQLNLDSTSAGSLAGIGISGNATAQTLAAGANGGKLDIAGKLTLAGTTAALGNTNISGTGTLSIAQGGRLELASTSVLDGVLTEINGTLSLGGEGNVVQGLAGSGVLTLNGHTLDLAAAQGKTHVYEGSVGQGTLNVTGRGTQVLRASSPDADLNVNGGNLVLQGKADVNAAALSYGDLVNRGQVTLQASDNSITALNTTLKVSSATFGTGSTTTFMLNTDGDLTHNFIESAGDIIVEDGAKFHVSSLPEVNKIWQAGTPMELTLIKQTGAGVIQMGDSDLTVGGLFLTYYKNAYLVQEGDRIVLKAEEQTDNIYGSIADTANSMAGAELVWAASRTGNVDQVFSDFLSALNSMVTADPGGASRSLAAAAGSTVTSLGAAQRDSLRDQMNWVRNRTTQMGANPNYVNADLPYFHMWMQGTGSYARLDTRTDESGYKLSTWGGTVGMDVDLSDNLTIGAAFTANYGNLTASAADMAEGDFDGYYVNLFARLQQRKWAHTFILTGAWSDADLNRTVNYGQGSYSTKGSTTGWGLGAMYELTYDIALNEKGSSILQPLFNASVVTTRMDGYSETGAGSMGLDVGKQEWTTGTVALGGRWTGLVGSNIFGRESLAELRVNAAQDMGDRRGQANVGLQGNPGFTQRVRGAQAGATALQIGAGLSVPVGTQGVLFIDGNADIRSGANSVNGSIGYRYNF